MKIAAVWRGFFLRNSILCESPCNPIHLRQISSLPKPSSAVGRLANIDITIQHWRHGRIPCFVDQSRTCLVALLGDVRRYVVNYLYRNIHDGDRVFMGKQGEKLRKACELRRRPSDDSPRQLFMDTFQPYHFRKTRNGTYIPCVGIRMQARDILRVAGAFVALNKEGGPCGAECILISHVAGCAHVYVCCTQLHAPLQRPAQ